MAKLLFILITAGALADEFAWSRSDPPLLIDAAPSIQSAPLDPAE